MQAQHDQWLNTPELCRELSISRSTLCRWQKRKLLRQGVHWVRPGSCCGLPRDQATWPLTSMRMATEALVCSPLISLKYVRRCTSGLWPITAATSA